MKRTPLICALLAALAVWPALAYEYPLPEGAIREAYFLGSGAKGHDASFYDGYARTIPNPAKEPPVSTITIDTPFLQIAEHSRDTPNFHVQDAVEQYFGKPAKFLLFADLYFRPPAQKQDSEDKTGGVKIELRQNHKTLATKIVDSWEIYPFRDARDSKESAGEHVELSCDAADVSNAPLKISVRTPDGNEFEVEFDLQEIR